MSEIISDQFKIEKMRTTKSLSNDKKPNDVELSVPNDTLDNAQLISEFIAIDDSVVITGTIDGAYEVDCYKIRCLDDGVGIVTALPHGPESYFHINIRNESGEYLAREIGFVKGESTTLRFPVNKGELMYIEVFCRGVESSDELLEYDLKFNLIDYNRQETVRDNDYLENAQRIYEGEHVIGFVDEYYDWDYYKIKFNSTGYVNFSLTPNHTNFRATLYLSDEEDYTLDSVNVKNAYAGTITYRVRAGQEYIVCVAQAKPANKYAYILHCAYEGQGGSPLTPILDSIDIVQQIENEAAVFYNTTSASKINKETMAAIRYMTEMHPNGPNYYGQPRITDIFSTKYWADFWGHSLNQKDDKFIAHLNTKFGTDAGDGRTFCALAKKLIVAVQDSRGYQIDFCHLLATLEGYTMPKLAGNMAPDSYFGWAGDLASQAGFLKLELQNNGLAENATNANNRAALKGLAGTTDIVTDIDAENIARNYSNTSNRVSTWLENYYSSFSALSSRFSTFLNLNGGENNIEADFVKTMTGTVRSSILKSLANNDNLPFGTDDIQDFYFNAMAIRLAAFVIELAGKE